MSSSDAVQASVRKHAEKLEQFCDHIMSCRVTLDAKADEQHARRLFSVHVDLRLPGDEIALSRDQRHEDLYVAIRDAFDAVQRQLEGHLRRARRPRVANGA